MIRAATKEDAPQIAHLLAIFGEEIFEQTGAMINTDITLIIRLFHESLGQGFRGYVYEADGRTIGFITFYDSFSLYAQGVFFTVSELYVAEAYRSQSIGKALLESVIQLAKEEKRTRLELTTPPLPEFQRSLDFYLKNRFEVTGGRKVKYDITIE